MNRGPTGRHGHHGHTHPADKMIPKGVTEKYATPVMLTWTGRGFEKEVLPKMSGVTKVLKKRHTKKQRSWNKKAVVEQGS